MLYHLYPSTVNVINLQQCTNYMVSTYNDTLFTTVPPFSLLRQRWQRLLKVLPMLRSGWQKYGSDCTKNTLSGNRCSADSLKTRPSDRRIKTQKNRVPASSDEIETSK